MKELPNGTRLELKNNGSTLSIVDEYTDRMVSRGLSAIRQNDWNVDALSWSLKRYGHQSTLHSIPFGTFEPIDYKIWADDGSTTIDSTTYQRIICAYDVTHLLSLLQLYKNIIITHMFSLQGLVDERCVFVDCKDAEKGLKYAQDCGWNLGIFSGANIYASMISNSKKCIAVCQDHGCGPPIQSIIDEIKQMGLKQSVREVNEWKGRCVVEDLQISEACCVFVGTTVHDAIQIMTGNEFDTVPVVNQKRRLVGIVSLAVLLTTQTKKVEECMTRFTGQKMKLVTLETRVMELQDFWDRKVDCVVVTDDSGRYVLGVVTEMDVNRFFSLKSA
jgi:CBS domain-containing protein